MTRDDLLPPLARITPSDQRGVLWIIATICLAFIYLTFAARVFVRWRRFQHDDYAILAACVLVLAQTSVSYGAVGLGLGVSRLTDEDDVQTVWQVSSSTLIWSISGLLCPFFQSAHICSAFPGKRGALHPGDICCKSSRTPDHSEDLTTKYELEVGFQLHAWTCGSAMRGIYTRHYNQLRQP